MSRTAPDRPPPPPRPRARPVRPVDAGRPPRVRTETQKARSRRGAIFPAPDLRGPKIALGFVWAVATAVALVLGPFFFAVLMAGTAAAAAAQAARSWRHAPTPRSPLAPASLAGAGVTVLAGLLGPVALVTTGVLAAIAAAAWVVADATRRGERATTADIGLTLLCAAVPVVAVAGPVLLRRHGLEVALVLMADALVYDVGAWVMGSGSRHRWLGPLAGMACIGSVTMAVAAFALQFRGASPWELGALAAVLAPLGPAAASLVLGDRRAPVGALRRLDSLVLLGPIWAVVAGRLGV
jgi:hypothetical protein